MENIGLFCLNMYTFSNCQQERKFGMNDRCPKEFLSVKGKAGIFPLQGIRYLLQHLISDDLVPERESRSLVGYLSMGRGWSTNDEPL